MFFNIGNCQAVAARLFGSKGFRLNQAGQATSEYGVVIIIAVALGMAVLSLFTGGVFDDVLHSLTGKALDVAKGHIK